MINIFSVLLSFLMIGATAPQKKSVVIFRSGFLQPVPPRVLTVVDDIIEKTFLKLRRFEVIGIKRQVTDPENFVNDLKTIQRKLVEKKTIKQARYGSLAISAEEARKIANSFYVIFPSVDYYRVVRVRYKDLQGRIRYKWRAKISLTLKVYYMQEGRWLSPPIIVRVSESDPRRVKAERDLFISLAANLEGAIRRSDIFKIKTRIKRVLSSGTVIIDGGRNFDFYPGLEFKVVDKAGWDLGYIKLSDVAETESKGKILWGTFPANSQIVENFMYGLHFSLVAALSEYTTPTKVKIDSSSSSQYYVITETAKKSSLEIGIRAEYEWGYALRPYFLLSLAAFSAVVIEGGIGYELILGRLSFEPYVGLGGVYHAPDVDITNPIYADETTAVIEGVGGFFLKPGILVTHRLSPVFSVSLLGAYRVGFTAIDYEPTEAEFDAVEYADDVKDKGQFSGLMLGLLLTLRF